MFKHVLYDKINNISYHNRYDFQYHFKGNLDTDVEFRPDNNLWDFLDWETEPSESFNELKKERALQLREKYKYLILMYSGGADSSTVLNTFLKNNIPIDEILTITFKRVNSSKLILPTYDITAFNKLKIISDRFPKTKITFVNKTFDDYYKFITRSDELVFKTNAHRSLGQYLRLPEDIYPLDFIMNSNTGIIHCENKPAIKIYDKKYYSIIFCAALMSKSSNMDLFFTSIDYPKLQIKQSHMVKNYLIKNKLGFNRFLSDSQSQDSKDLLAKICRDTVIEPYKLFSTRESENTKESMNLDNPYSELGRIAKAMKEDNRFAYDAYHNGIRENNTESTTTHRYGRHKYGIGLRKDFFLGKEK